MNDKDFGKKKELKDESEDGDDKMQEKQKKNRNFYKSRLNTIK